MPVILGARSGKMVSTLANSFSPISRVAVSIVLAWLLWPDSGGILAGGVVVVGVDT